MSPVYSRAFKPWKVYVEGKVDPDLQVLNIRRSVNGHRVDAVELQAKEEKKAARNNKTVRPFGFDGKKLKVVEITNNKADKVLMAGVLSQQNPRIKGDYENVSYVVRTEPFLFGAPVGFYPDYLAVPPGGGLEELSLHRPLVFNPEIDGRTRFNRDQYASANFNKEKSHAFIEYDSTRTDKAKLTFEFFAEENPLEWTLLDIVQYLCWVLNPREDFVKNPTDEHLKEIFGDQSEAEAVRDFAVRTGDYLPDVLDDLLNPRGYSWFVEHEKLGKRRLKFFRRGEGKPQCKVNMGKPGTRLDPAKHNCCGLDLKFDSASCVNRVVVLGSRIRVETTVELVRCWETGQDSKVNTDRDTLRKSEENAGFDAVRDVWRKWALNESGDYTGLRPEITGYFKLTEHAALEEWDDVWVPRRRQFLPMLTLGSDLKPLGQKGGCCVEFKTKDAEGNDTWEAVGDDMVCHLAEDECAVYFGGEFPPERIYEMGEDAKVRITATFETDLPLGHDITEVSQDSPTETPISLVLDMSDHFHRRFISETSIFSKSAGGNASAHTYQTDEVDDTERLKEYAKRVLEAEEFGQIAGTLVLEGVEHKDLDLGVSIHIIDGRDILLDAVNEGEGKSRYPSVVGISYDIPAQKTYLTLETFRKHTLPTVT